MKGLESDNDTMGAEFQKDEFDENELGGEAGGNQTSCQAVTVVQTGDV